MSTWNGAGTRYMGLTPANQPDTYYATKWFVLADLPILPLRREKIVINREKMESMTKSLQMIEVVARLPFSFSNAFRTWFLSWFVVLPLLLGPLVLFVLGAAKVLLPFFASMGWFWFSIIWIFVLFVLFFAVSHRRKVI